MNIQDFDVFNIIASYTINPLCQPGIADSFLLNYSKSPESELYSTLCNSKDKIFIPNLIISP
jgi:hypothetical protein